MRPKLIHAITTYFLLSLAGGGSFLLPDELHVPDARVTPAVTLPVQPASRITGHGVPDDRAIGPARASERDGHDSAASPVS